MVYKLNADRIKMYLFFFLAYFKAQDFNQHLNNGNI